MPKKLLNETEAAVLLQQRWRGKQVSKKYRIQQLPLKSLASYPVFLVGNDPKIKGLKPYSTPTGTVALVGTSGLRALGILCELGNKKSVPKLIIVDNSIQVVCFWRALRELAIQLPSTQDARTFLKALSQFIQKQEDFSAIRKMDSQQLALYGDTQLEYENQDPLLYIHTLIKQHGLPYLLSVIKNTSVIAQDWANSSLFAALKNILKFHSINRVYAYPSNIGELPGLGKGVCESIIALNPDLSITTHSAGRNGFFRPPTKVFLTTKENLIAPVPKTPSTLLLMLLCTAAALCLFVALFAELDEKNSSNQMHSMIL